jgi:hypothetical protein
MQIMGYICQTLKTAPNRPHPPNVPRLPTSGIHAILLLFSKSAKLLVHKQHKPYQLRPSSCGCTSCRLQAP